ncbi:unnamed protein product [Closterium sp. NIES-54]
MAEHIDVTTLMLDRLNELLRQLHESSEEIAALTVECTSLQNDVARAQQAQSQAPGTPGRDNLHNRHRSTEVWGSPQARPVMASSATTETKTSARHTPKRRMRPGASLASRFRHCRHRCR